MCIMFVDLGTGFTLASVWQDGQPLVLTNEQGETLTPSAVAEDEHGVLLTGRAAHDFWLLKPTSGAVSFKRLMGTDRRIRVGSQVFTAVDLSALLLRQMAACYFQALGTWPTDVVISVPAHFSGLQREATRLAGRLAGLNVRRLVSEPTAAALAYGLHEAPDPCQFAVLDLGAGTLDCSVVDHTGGLLEVRACAGDNELGGEDFLEALSTLAAEQMPGLPAWDGNSELHSQIWHESERVKRLLSTLEAAEFNVVWRGQTHSATITRAAFEKRAQPLLARVRHTLSRALREAQLQAADLRRVVLAGGASRMPMVRHLVEQLFGAQATVSLDPDEAVARGGAALAGMLARAVELDEVVLVDRAPTTLGIETCRRAPDDRVVDGYMATLIPRNSALPVSKVERFTTVCDQQAVLAVQVYQGESRHAANNLLLGTLDIPVPPKPAGEAVVDVRFTYDNSGLLEVLLTQPETGETRKLVVVHATATMSDARVAERLAALAAIKVHPRDQLVNQAVLARGNRVHAMLLGPERERLAEVLFQFDMALRMQDGPAIALLRSRLDPLLVRHDRR